MDDKTTPTTDDPIEESPVDEVETASEPGEATPVDVAAEEPIEESEAIDDTAVEESVETPEAVDDAAVEESAEAPEAADDAAVEESIETPEATDDAAAEESVATPEAIDDDAAEESVATPEAADDAVETPEEVIIDESETIPVKVVFESKTSGDSSEEIAEEESFDTIPFAQEFDLSPEAIARLENLTEQVVFAIDDDDKNKTPSAMDVVPEETFGSTRQLPSLDSIAVDQTRIIDYGYARHVGRVRQNNEDSLFALATKQINVQENPDFCLFIVADGAGGHADGEKASTVVSQTVAKVVTERIYKSILMQIVDAEADPLPPIAEVLIEAVLTADEKSRQQVPGGGCTLTAMVIIGDLAHIAHVGDSRAYLLLTDEETQETQLEQLTRDHSVAKRLEEIGQITSAEAVGHPEAGRLWKIMGLTDNLEPDINMRRIPSGSHILLCSDGLWNMVEEGTIKNTILQSSTSQEAADRLVEAANNNGGLDNIAVIVLQIP